MAVKYGEFKFDKSPPRPTMRSRGGPSTPMAYAGGGSVSTPFRYKDGGGIGRGMSHVGKGGVKDPGPTRADKGNRQDAVRAPAFAKGGMAHGGGCTCKMCSGGPMKKADGGGVSPDIADAPVKQGKKSSWNKDDAVSPGSPKRVPPSQGTKNKSAASDKFATKGENTEPATKQKGTVQRMAGWSDFKKGGKVMKKASGGSTTPYKYASGGKMDRFEESDERTGSTRESKDTSGTSKKVKGDGEAYKSGGRISNLGKYAHGGKVWSDGSKQRPGGDDKYEAAAGTPKKAPGSKGEVDSGVARKAEGGLSRAPSPKRSAAIHAKMHKGPSMGHRGTSGALAGLANALSGQGAPSQGGGMAPPGMAPSMGSPPGGPAGGMAPQAPTMGGGPPAMARGGNVTHVFHHHISHGAPGRK